MEGFILELLAEQPPVLDTGFDRNKRDYDDLTTLFAEMVDGSMRTPFEYRPIGQELYARDGSVMRQEFETGLADADRIADARPNLAFEVRRRRIEMDEYYDMFKMTEGRLPNTMVVVSDFPPELMDTEQDVGGYNVARKQTMLRVLAWDGSKLTMHSQSLDGSDRQALEDVYGSLGRRPRPGELLGQRVHLDLDETEQKFLVDRLTGTYDQSLRNRFGGNWHAGRQDESSINTYDFVLEQRDLIQLAMQQNRAGQLDIYGLAATLDARFRENRRVQPERIMARSLDPFYNLQAEIAEHTTQAKLMRKVFSACGLSIEAAELSAADERESAGYGNRTSEKTDYSFNKKAYCVVCQAPPPEHAVKKFCGPCSICIDCDRSGRASRK
jgi:hypothetical protein